MDYEGLSDIELWKSHQNGDKAAYNVLFDRYAEFLYTRANRWLRNHLDAEELVMDLFLHLWLKRDQLNPEAGKYLKSYLSKALRNRIINHLHKQLAETVTIDETADLLMDSRRADDHLRLKETEEQYERCLKALSPQRRKVFKLSREEGLTYSQIAEKLNLSINTVENYMTAALAVLRTKKDVLLSIVVLMTMTG